MKSTAELAGEEVTTVSSAESEAPSFSSAEALKREVRQQIQENRVINLSGWKNRFEDSGLFLRAIRETLEQCTEEEKSRITVLNLNGTEFGTAHMEALSEIVQQLPSLTALCLAENGLGNENAEGVSAIEDVADMLEHCPQLEILMLNGNHIGATAAEGLALGLGILPNLRILVLHSNVIGDEGIEHLAKSLQNIPRLEQLDIAENEITDDGARILANAFRYIPALERLDIGRNDLQNAGAGALSAVLPELTGLEQLILDSNDIGPKGAKALGTSLRQIPSIVHFSINSNHIGNQGTVALARGLTNAPHLKKLRITDNQVGDQGAIMLASRLRHCAQLRTLDISNNNVTLQGWQSLSEHLLPQPQLQVLNVQHNQIVFLPAEMAAIRQELTGNGKRKAHINGNSLGQENIHDIPPAKRSRVLTPQSDFMFMRSGQRAGLPTIPQDNSTAIEELLTHVRAQLETESAIDLSGYEGRFNNPPLFCITVNSVLNALSPEHKACITAIDLSNNNITASDLPVLTAVLDLPNLQTLNISNNFIGDEGAAMAASALQNTTSLQVLDVASNGITRNGWQALSDYIVPLPKLEELRINDNAIAFTLPDAQHIEHVLKTRRQLVIWAHENTATDKPILDIIQQQNIQNMMGIPETETPALTTHASRVQGRRQLAPLERKDWQQILERKDSPERKNQGRPGNSRDRGV